MRRIARIAGLVLGVGVAGAALADVAREVTKLGGSKITFWVQPFLDDTELATLRLVATNKDALNLFVPSTKGYAAIALSPDDGFMKGGAPAASATAIADLPDAESAAAKALEGCNAARKGAAECVIVMEIGPAK